MQLAEQRLYKQPNIKNIKQLGKENDIVFQALAYMGNASYQVSWANTVLSQGNKVSEEVLEKMKKINREIVEIQEKIRNL